MHEAWRARFEASEDGEMTLVRFDDGGLAEWHPASRLSREHS